MVAWPFRIAAARKNTSKELRMEVPKELTMEEVLAAIRKTFADEETEENRSDANARLSVRAEFTKR